MVRVALLALLVILVNPTLAPYPITEEKMRMVRRAPLWSGGHIAERKMILRVGCCLGSRETTEQGMGSEGSRNCFVARKPQHGSR